MRNILADKPRVTKFPIEFDGPAEGEALPVAGDMSEQQQQQVGTGPSIGALLGQRAQVHAGNWLCSRRLQNSGFLGTATFAAMVTDMLVVLSATGRPAFSNAL